MDDKLLATQLVQMSIGRLTQKEFNEYVTDYFYHPKEYDIDESSLYYRAISHAYYDLDHAYKVYNDFFGLRGK